MTSVRRPIESETIQNEHISIHNITPLHAAALAGDHIALKKLLSSGCVGSLETKDEFGRTPLIYAVMGNHLECAQLFLKYGARVDNSDNEGQTALHWAAYKGLHLCVKMLLEKKALWHQKDVEGITALHLAAHNKSSKCLSLILKETLPGQVDIQDSNKRTALHWSAKYCSSENIQLLLKEGANICIPDVDGKTPLHLVARCSNPAAVKCVKMLLQESPGVINWQDYEGRSALHSAVATGTTDVVDVLTSKEKCNINLLDNMFRTPLHWAAALGFANKVSLLLDRGADYSSTDGNGARPLHYAAQENHAETVSMFLSRRYVKDEPDFEGFTALMWAAARHSDDVIQIMFDYGIDLSAGDKNGTTALHAAASQGHTSTIDLLLDLGAKIDAKDKEEMTPLLRACEMGRVKAVQLLYERGANLFAVDVDGHTALHWASRGGHAYLCQILLQHSVDVDAKDYYGRTALMYASFKGYMNCMSVMLENKANLDCHDNEGKTALHWACIKGNLDAVRLLLEYGADVNFLCHGNERWTPLDYAVNGEHQEIVNCLQEHGGISRTQFQEAAAIKIQACFRGYRVRRLRSASFSQSDDLTAADTLNSEKMTTQEQSQFTDMMNSHSADGHSAVMNGSGCLNGLSDDKSQDSISQTSGAWNSSYSKLNDKLTKIPVAVWRLPKHQDMLHQRSNISYDIEMNSSFVKSCNEPNFFWGFESKHSEHDLQHLRLFCIAEMNKNQPVYCAKCGEDILNASSSDRYHHSSPSARHGKDGPHSRTEDEQVLVLFGSKAALKKAEDEWKTKLANLCIEEIPLTKNNGSL